MGKPMSADHVKRRDDLDARLQNAALKGAWQRDPKKKAQEVHPWLWRWHDIKSNLLEAGELIPLDDVMRMRTIRLVNPSQSVAVGTAKTFGVTIQHLNPGEITESHRHTSASLYFVIEGNGCFTTAEGEQQFMAPGDLLVQPSWTWHGTKNTGAEPALWLTSMDTPLNDFLEAYFREKYPDGFLQPFTKPDGYHLRRMRTLPRSSMEANNRHPIKYLWKEAIDTLHALADANEGDPYDGVVLEYINPITGGSTTETIGCCMQMLRPGEETQSHRHTSNTIYHVVSGAGVSKIGKNKGAEEILKWETRDCFIVPSWQWHGFKNDSATEPAILFSVSDRPLLQATRLYREDHS